MEWTIKKREQSGKKLNKQKCPERLQEEFVKNYGCTLLEITGTVSQSIYAA